MENKDLNPGLPRWGYWAWLIVLIIGLVFSTFMGYINYRDWIGEGSTEVAFRNGMANFFFFAFIFGVVSLFLWFRRKKTLPSLAFIITLILGIFFSMFGLAESIGGWTTRPIDYSLAVGGLMEFAVIAIPFLVIAWLLWVRPKIGGILLMLLGVIMGIWIFIGWNIEWTPDDFSELIMPIILTALPILLGFFTFSKAVISGRKDTMKNNHA